MSEKSLHPIDLNLWRRIKTAPTEDLWKWGATLWDPIVTATTKGEVNINELPCPVCSAQQLYSYFLAVAISRVNSTRDKRSYIADRWYGCHACRTQVRDRGLIPAWVSDDQIRWATDSLQEQSESDFKTWFANAER